MTIKRDYLVIQLTEQELQEAYEEQQHKYDVADVQIFADMCDDNYRDQPYIDLIRDTRVTEKVAERYRKYIDDNLCNMWTEYMDLAVMEIGERVAQGKEMV